MKGGFAVFEITDLQAIVHEAENKFTAYKGQSTIPSDQLTYFLNILDQCRVRLNGGSVDDAKLKIQTPNKEEVIQKATQDKKLSAVVVDDEQDIVDILVNLLIKNNFEVKGFTDPKAAIEHCLATEPELVLSDMMMPGYNGIDVLRGVNKSKAHIPVVFVSGHLDKEVLISAINDGAEGVVEKPFKLDYVANVALNVARKTRLSRLFDRTINLMLYQYSDFDDYLKAQGKEDTRKVIEQELSDLITQRRYLRELSKK